MGMRASILIAETFFTWAIPCHAENAAIDNGLNWLSGSQNAEGSWGTLARLQKMQTK